MWLTISVEGQNCTEIGLSQVLSDTVTKLYNISSLSQESVQRRYGEEFMFISIIPSCVDEVTWQCLGWKERVLVRRKSKEADIRLRINHSQFVHADAMQKQEIFTAVLVESIRKLQTKSKCDFNGQALIDDILKALQ